MDVPMSSAARFSRVRGRSSAAFFQSYPIIGIIGESPDQVDAQGHTLDYDISKSLERVDHEVDKNTIEIGYKRLDIVLSYSEEVNQILSHNSAEFGNCVELILNITPPSRNKRRSVVSSCCCVHVEHKSLQLDNIQIYCIPEQLCLP